MRSVARLGIIVALVALGSLARAETASESVRLGEFFERVFERNLERSPIMQSRLGIRTDQHRWDDISEARQIEDADLVHRDLQALAAYRFDALDEASRLSYRLFEHDLREALSAFEWRRHGYLVTQMAGMHRRVATTLLNSHPITGQQDADAYIARLAGVDALMSQLVAELARQEAAGVRPPRFVYDLTIGESQNLLKGRPFDESGTDSPLLADFRTKIADAKLPAAEQEALIERAVAALSDGFEPGYRRLIEHLRRAREQATDEAGVWKLPQGEQYYRYALERYTTLPLDPDDVHQLGLREVVRIHGEMRRIMQQVRFEGSLEEFFQHLREDSRFYYPDTPQGRERYLDDARRLLDEMRARQGEVFSSIPRADVIVRPVEPWRERSAARAFYQGPSQDGTRPGIFFINLYDMRAAPRYQLPALLYHEAIPGHHLETALAYELENLPRFRKFSSIAAFSEGWSLYAERLAKEMGFYQDLYDDFGRLALELMRAARLVVDTGLHAKRWSREQAIEYFDRNTPGSHYDNRREVERYIVLPGQATSYAIGMLRILGLRDEARAKLGQRFDLRAFHDAVLGGGPLPLPVLEERVRDWVREQSETTLVHAGRLLADPASALVKERQTLVIRDGRIVEIRDGFVSEGGAVIDLSRQLVLPGLIDSHVHLCHENGPDDRLHRVTRNSADWTIACVHFAGKTLQAGFTTVANVGDDNDAIFALREGIARGEIAGPTVLSAGSVVSPHGGDGDVHGYRADVAVAVRRPTLCSGAEDCRRVIREHVARGADFIKIVATGSVLADVSQGVGRQFMDDELRAIVETAHALGRRVTAHAHGADGINQALSAGVDSIEHGTFLDEESIRLFKSRGAYLVPTLLAGDTVTAWARDPQGFLSPAVKEKALLVGPRMLDATRRAHRAGVKVAFGTDASVAPHGSNAKELSLMVRAGFTPAEAIAAATIHAAEHLGIAARAGSLAPGKAADLIAVNGDPLVDVAVLEHVGFVMKGGQIYRDESGDLNLEP